MSGRSRVVFVGNIPYDMAEEQLISIFSEVGPVVGFRLVFDRDTGKPKGYGFCEFHDPETAASAVRNLNDVDVGGRSLRIDWADVDPVFQGRTTQMGQIEGELPKREGRRPPLGGPNAGFGGGANNTPPQGGPGGMPPQMGFNTHNVPQGTPLPPGKSATDAITDTLATLPPNQLLDVMGHIKSLVLTSPKDAQGLLSAHPQLTYALFQAMLMMNLVDPAILQRTLAGSGAVGPPPVQQQQQGPPPPFQQQQQQRPPAWGGAPQQQQQQQPPPQHQQRYPPQGGAGGPPPPNPYGAPQAAGGPYGIRPPPPGQPPQPQAGQPYSNTPPQPPARPPMGSYGPGPGGYGAPQATNTPPTQYGLAPPPPPPQAAAAVAPGGAGGGLAALSNPDLPDSQRQLLNQVLSLTDAQIAALPAEQKDSIMMLRRQYGK